MGAVAAMGPPMRVAIRRWKGARGGKGRLDIGIPPGALVALVDEQSADGFVKVLDLDRHGAEYWLPSVVASGSSGGSRRASPMDVAHGKEAAAIALGRPVRIVSRLLGAGVSGRKQSAVE